MRPAIRPAVGTDVPAIVELDEVYFGREAWSSAAWDGEFERLTEDRVILVADEGALAGYVVLLVPPVEVDVVELLRIAVAPDGRRTGIGGQLMTALAAYRPLTSRSVITARPLFAYANGAISARLISRFSFPPSF